MNAYKVGNGNNQIRLAVDVTTTGMAATRAFILGAPPAYQATDVAASADATGDIVQTKIGQASDLQNKTLSVITKIHITGSDINSRKSEFNSLSAKYVLDNGTEGHKEFAGEDNKIDVSNGNCSDIELYKAISLT